MRKFMKFAASVVAATTIVTGAAGISVNAEEEYLSDFSEILAEAESSDSGYTFPAYDSYSTALVQRHITWRLSKHLLLAFL